MERERSGKVIAIATLIVGIIGLSLGFAAFSTSLNITSNADVQVDSSVWNVGFSTVNNALTPGTVNGQTNSANNGTLALTQFVISQTNNAVLKTVNGSKVDYDFYIYNDGDMDAYLNSITMGNLTCAYNTSATPRQTDGGHTTITSESTGTIAPVNCQALFNATLTLDTNAISKSDGESLATGFGNTAKITKKTGIPAKLTIEYIADSMSTLGNNAPTGDFVVSLGDSVVVYGSAAN